MRRIFLILLLPILAYQQIITAQLNLVQYEPLTFQLIFSEEIERPEFQLFYKTNNELNYKFLT